MASCDVQATPSNDKSNNITDCSKQVETTQTTDTPLPKDSPIAKAETTNEAANMNNVNVNRKVETSSVKSGSNMPLPTKIPCPIHVGNGFHNRKYTTLMKSLDRKKVLDDSFSSTSTLVNTTEDSGVHMDCSTVDDDNSNCRELSSLRPSCSTPLHGNSTETLAATDSFLQLEKDEQQTLLVLQRAVAEMEADVAMHSAKLEKEIQLEVDKRPEVKDEQVDTTPSKSSCPSGSGVQERKHVRVEQLLEAEHNIEMLHKLLQPGSELVNNDAIDLPQSGDDLSGSELIAARDLDATERQTRKEMGLVYSLLHIFCGKNIRKLSYPILFCGMAVGLIFYFRKD
ncbi:uncharacterized protein LOC117566210 [Drosophila albomicans]|uniref:Uncharacterized protein LOC117566210 n=1 Tax=Drosophila albomicans TaxID=7291 RepID=A0A6P8WDE4_DROAB|nr:uncharacterized protein LOC117566210 [Drosophila albomicans]